MAVALLAITSMNTLNSSPTALRRRIDGVISHSRNHSSTAKPAIEPSMFFCHVMPRQALPSRVSTPMLGMNTATRHDSTSTIVYVPRMTRRNWRGLLKGGATVSPISTSPAKMMVRLIVMSG